MKNFGNDQFCGGQGKCRVEINNMAKACLSKPRQRMVVWKIHKYRQRTLYKGNNLRSDQSVIFPEWENLKFSCNHRWNTTIGDDII